MAAALSGFAEAVVDSPCLPGVGGELQAALDAFARSWGVTLAAASHRGRVTAAEVVHAADLYAQLEELLIPGGLR
jgi:hypothetical protein